MPEYRFLGVKTDQKKYFSHLFAIIGIFLHLAAQAMLLITGFAFLIFPLWGADVTAWGIVWRVVFGSVTICGALCAMHVARVEKPWREGDKWNAVRMIAAGWTGLVVIAALFTKNWFAALLILGSLGYITLPRGKKEEPEA